MELWKHKNSGNLYKIVQNPLPAKTCWGINNNFEYGYSWRRNGQLLYKNLKGKYFTRYIDDFYNNFEQVNIPWFKYIFKSLW